MWMHAFVHRHSGAEREHQHRDHEAPEIELAAVAERMEVVGRPLRRAAAPHQQQLVGGIDDAVHALGQHRRGAGDRGRDELGRGDAEVRQQRDDQRPRAGGRRAHWPELIAMRPGLSRAVPPFTTASTCSSRATSRSGSPRTATSRRSGRPRSRRRRCGRAPRDALRVAAWIAWSGVMPHWTILANCLPLSPCG